MKKLPEFGSVGNYLSLLSRRYKQGKFVFFSQGENILCLSTFWRNLQQKSFVYLLSGETYSRNPSHIYILEKFTAEVFRVSTFWRNLQKYFLYLLSGEIYSRIPL
jgi:hypothetical protein